MIPAHRSLPSYKAGNVDASIYSTRQGLLRVKIRGQRSLGPQHRLVSFVGRFVDGMVECVLGGVLESCEGFVDH